MTIDGNCSTFFARPQLTFRCMSQPDHAKLLAALQKNLHTKQVLLADRLPASRDALRKLLAPLGLLAVREVANAADVLRRVRNQRYDLIITDFYLDQGRDAQQLLEEMRHNRSLPRSTAYLVVTGEGSYENVLSLAELEPDAYLLRPFPPEELQIRVLRALYRKQHLQTIFNLIEQGKADEAIAACDALAAKEPELAHDAQRQKGELLLQLGRNREAEAVFRHVLSIRSLPWARMGLARTQRAQGHGEEAAALASELLNDAPVFLAVNDFLAATLCDLGRLEAAQHVLQYASERSPNNTRRQRQLGDLASRTGDLRCAETAYQAVIDRCRGSSQQQLDDFVNLARVQVAQGQPGSARTVLEEMRRVWRNDRQAEMAALIGESLCLSAEGRTPLAVSLVRRALQLRQTLEKQQQHVLLTKNLSPRITVDLARACYATGHAREAEQLVQTVVRAHQEDTQVISQVEQVLARSGRPDQGRHLLEQVDQAMVALNNRGIQAARSGNLRGAVELLMQAADEAPNLQFLLNAAKAIYTLLDQEGWETSLAQRADDYLRRAEQKDPESPKVNAARLLRSAAARKHGIDPRRRYV